MALRKLLKNSIYIIVLRLNVVAKFMILIIKGLLRLDYMMKFTTEIMYMHDLKYKIYFYTEGEFLEMLEEIVKCN